MILIDSAEPAEIERLLSQVTVVVRSPLNKNSMSDYYFSSLSGKRMQFGRVQAGELLANIDSMEDELRRYYNQADESFQVIEGVVSPVPLAALTEKQIHAVKSGKLKWNQLHTGLRMWTTSEVSTRSTSKSLTFTYRVEFMIDADGVKFGYLTSGRAFEESMSMLYVWIHRLAEAGITTYFTENYEETAKLLGLIYRNEQKPEEEHTTLNRIVKPRIVTKEKDPLIKALMFLSSAYKLGIGEKTATIIADKYVSIGDIFLTSVDELTSIEGIGVVTAEKILSALGREV